MQLHVFSRFKNAITLAKNKIFPFWKKFLVAGILFYKKQQSSAKIDPGPPSPGPLNVSGADILAWMKISMKKD